MRPVWHTCFNINHWSLCNCWHYQVVGNEKNLVVDFWPSACMAGLVDREYEASEASKEPDKVVAGLHPTFSSETLRF